MAKAASIPVHERELLRGAQVAAVLGISRTSFYKLKREELLPAPVMIDGVPLWRRRELVDWCDSGCPPLVEWHWEPTMQVRAEDAVRLKVAELTRVRAEIDQLRELLERGERLTMVRTRA